MFIYEEYTANVELQKIAQLFSVIIYQTKCNKQKFEL